MASAAAIAGARIADVTPRARDEEIDEQRARRGEPDEGGVRLGARIVERERENGAERGEHDGPRRRTTARGRSARVVPSPRARRGCAAAASANGNRSSELPSPASDTTTASTPSAMPTYGAAVAHARERLLRTEAGRRTRGARSRADAGRGAATAGSPSSVATAFASAFASSRSRSRSRSCACASASARAFASAVASSSRRAFERTCSAARPRRATSARPPTSPTSPRHRRRRSAALILGRDVVHRRRLGEARRLGELPRLLRPHARRYLRRVRRQRLEARSARAHVDEERLALSAAEVAKASVEDRDVPGAQRIDRLPASRTQRRPRTGGARPGEMRPSGQRRGPHAAPSQAQRSKKPLKRGSISRCDGYFAGAPTAPCARPRHPRRAPPSVTTSGGEKRSTRSPAAVRSTPASASFGRMSRTTKPCLSTRPRRRPFAALASRRSPGVLRERLAQHRGEASRPSCLAPSTRLLLFEDREHRPRRRARERVAAERRAVRARRQRARERLGRQHRADREAAAEALREGDRVRLRAGVLEAEPPTESADARLHLVDQAAARRAPSQSARRPAGSPRAEAARRLRLARARR